MDIDAVGMGPGESWSPRLNAASVREHAKPAAAPPPISETAVRPDESSILAERVSRANEEMASIRSDLKFSIHEKSGQMVLQIVDPSTGEVLRQSPPQEFLDLTVRLQEMVGVFLDETK